MRGLWVVRTALVSPEAVDQVVDQARTAGFNALFVQVRGRGDAFYRSRLVTRSPLLAGQPADFDPLSRLLERARAGGLEVHAWINVLLTAHFRQRLPADHVVSRHPEWVMVPRVVARQALTARPDRLLALVRSGSRGDPDVEGFYLSPSAPGVAAHLEDVVRELVETYAVDGLHLDFIRYPGRDYDYSRAALEDFARRPGGQDPLAGRSTGRAAWDDYRRDVLTDLAERLARTARRARADLVVSAAVVPDEASAVNQKWQAWPNWVARGIVDAVCPMAYTPDGRVFRRLVEQARALVGAGRPLWIGVGAYRLQTAEVIGRIREARESGASGVVIFSHESLAPDGWRRLRDEAFTQTAADSGGAVSGPR
jgi:uncharacterized lipoprotein YddW (UPF0748 family)